MGANSAAGNAKGAGTAGCRLRSADCGVGQRQIGTIYTSSRQYKLILEVQPQFQDDPSALSRIYLTTPSGARVPLSAVARFSPKIEPLTVNHQGQFPSVTLSFNVAPGYSLGQAVERIRAIQEQLHTPSSPAGETLALLGNRSGRG